MTGFHSLRNLYALVEPCHAPAAALQPESVWPRPAAAPKPAEVRRGAALVDVRAGADPHGLTERIKISKRGEPMRGRPCGGSGSWREVGEGSLRRSALRRRSK